MPELPEVENLKRSLEPLIVGAKVNSVRLHRPDVVHFRQSDAPSRSIHKQLLGGRRIASLARRGKQLAIVADDGSALCIQLGMSGQLRYLRHRQRMTRNDHVHCVWWLSGRTTHGRLAFRDPRRFGRITAFASLDELESGQWAALGPEAITISSSTLKKQLLGTHRTIKPVLLDQNVIAGIGNIYADEALFAARLHPASTAQGVAHEASRSLAESIRSILRSAVSGGGSTIRDYTDATGRSGSFVSEHKVYGRAGRPCVRCSTKLKSEILGQRTTVFCPRCQELMT